MMRFLLDKVRWLTTLSTISKSCRICGNPSTIKAHLLPRAFAHDIRADQPNFQIYSINKPGFRISQAGVYDDSILCEKHERAIQPYDDYAVEFCRNFPSQRKMLNDHMFSVDVDSDLLVRFVVSVLWRYSVSTRPEARKVNLGPHEPFMRDIVFGGGSCCPEPALIIWANRINDMDVTKFCIPPAIGRFKDFRHCSFLIRGLTFVLKVDKRQVPKAFLLLPINGKAIIISTYKDFDKSQEFSEMLNIIK